jgi:sulfite oxidase
VIKLTLKSIQYNNNVVLPWLAAHHMNRLAWRSIILPAVGTVLTSPLVFFEHDKELREFTAEEVRLNDGTNGKPTYVTYRGGVYDISKFKDIHPGGNHILQAAGGDVEGFWNVWAYHFLSQKVQDYLMDIRIGTIKNVGDSDSTSLDAYRDEPIRNYKPIKVLTYKPFCSETKSSDLNLEYFTEAERLYVRNHAPVPQYLSADSHHIILQSSSDESMQKQLTVSDLYSHFKKRRVSAVIQCAGNRASEDLAATGPSGFCGTPFEDIESGMVGNVLWTGVWLREVLQREYPVQCAAATGGTNRADWHVVFSGADGYDASVPLDIVLDAKNSCMLATHMNNEELTPDHGYPLRAVLPGIAGARSVKWLESITLSPAPCDAPWNSYYYKRSDGSHIQYLPLQSIILSPTKNDLAVLSSANTVEVSGVAYCAGGSDTRIIEVEVSADEGKTWTTARLMNEELVRDDAQSFHGWVRFQAHVRIPTSVSVEDSDFKAIQSARVCCRARDDKGNIQPKVSAKQRGYLYNGWNMIDFQVKM